MARERRTVVLGRRSVPATTDLFVLFDTPPGAGVAWPAGIAWASAGAFAWASWQGPGSSAAMDEVVAFAQGRTDVACVASTDGRGSEPRGAALVSAIRERVLPALDRHFDAMSVDALDTSPWLLTHVAAALVQRKLDAATIAELAATVERSLGRGDATSTSQNLTALANVLYAARRAVPSLEPAISPVLAAMSAVADSRRHTGSEPFATFLASGLAGASERHARALVQLAVRCCDGSPADATRFAAELADVIGAILAVPGVADLVRAREPERELALRAAATRKEQHLRSKEVDTSHLARVVAALPT